MSLFINGNYYAVWRLPILIADSRTEKYEHLRVLKAEKKMSTDFDV